MSNYNGWKNWDTWATNLNLTNDPTLYGLLTERSVTMTELQEIFNSNAEFIPDFEEIDQEKVDWFEVLDAINDL